MPWSNAAPANYVLLLKNGFETAFPGVQSETSEDLEGFLPEVYRDELDSTFMGTGRSLIIEQAGGGVAVTNGLQVETPGIISGALTYDSPSDPHLEQSDSFLHVDPRPTPYTRTRLIWWSGATGTGDVVGWAWMDRIEAFSPSNYIQL
jgi:hypothetical protein